MPYKPPEFRHIGLIEAPECRFEAAPKDKTLPDGFQIVVKE